MGDVPQARVRVSPTRLRQIKKQISKLDREIQGWQSEIDRVNCSIDICRLSGTAQSIVDRWEKALDRAEQKRADLDAKRKALRLEAKGYAQPIQTR